MTRTFDYEKNLKNSSTLDELERKNMINNIRNGIFVKIEGFPPIYSAIDFLSYENNKKITYMGIQIGYNEAYRILKYGILFSAYDCNCIKGRYVTAKDGVKEINIYEPNNILNYMHCDLYINGNKLCGVNEAIYYLSLYGGL